ALLAERRPASAILQRPVREAVRRVRRTEKSGAAVRAPMKVTLARKTCATESASRASTRRVTPARAVPTPVRAGTVADRARLVARAPIVVRPAVSARAV